MEIKKMGLLVMSLLIMIGGGIFMEIKNAEATKCMEGARCLFGFCDTDDATGSTCSDNGVSGHVCTSSSSIPNISVCMIDPWPGARPCVSTDVCMYSVPAGSIPNYKFCSENNCRTAVGGINVDDPSTNGEVCRVTTKGMTTSFNFLEGVWDNSQKQCVECGLNNKEVGVYGDSNNTYIVGPSPYAMDVTGMALANNNFEHACGADASCDEKIVREACTGGHCDLNGKCCLAPKVLDAGNNCVLAAVPAIYLTITPSKNAIGASPDTTNVTFRVKDESGANVNGANIVITAIGCGAGSDEILSPPGSPLPAPPHFATGPGGTAVSVFTAPTVASGTVPGYCLILATATDGALTSSATGRINILGGTCIDAVSGNSVIAFNKSDYAIGDTIMLIGGDSTRGGCVRLYYPMGTVKASDTFVADSFVNPSVTAAAGETGTWYGGLFFGPCGVYAAADCQIKVEVTASAVMPPSPPCIPSWGAWTACAGAPGSQNQSDSMCGGSRGRSCCDVDFGNVISVNHCALPLPVCDAPANQCVECLTTPDCDWKGSDYVCDNKKCIPCKGEGEAAAGSHLCCYGLNWLNGICTSACDPNSWFFCNPLRTNVEALAAGGERIIGYILGLIGSVVLLLIVISGAMYMTSAGSEEKIASSKKVLTAAVIGLAIALLAYSLLLVIMTVLGM